jgi:hypothetical protein
VHRDLEIANAITRRLRLIALQAGGPTPQPGAWKHVPKVFSPIWLASLGLPIDGHMGAEQTVALVDGEHFDRSAQGADVAAAYSNHPRTQVYESVGARSGGWFAAVDKLLMRLFRCEVVCSVYVSSAGDATIGMHRDEWYGIIMQLAGSKTWTLLPPSGVQSEILLEAGDVLLLPRDVRHDIATPDHSVHVAFAILTDEPLGTFT